MALRSIRVRNFRSIEDSGELALGPVTLIVGRNNSGKTSLLRALYTIQGAQSSEPPDLRLRSRVKGSVTFKFDQDPPAFLHGVPSDIEPTLVELIVEVGRGSLNYYLRWPIAGSQYGQREISSVSERRPHHYIVPVLARRRSERYESTVGSESAEVVADSDRTLTSRIAALSTGDHKSARSYRARVEKMFGFSVGTFLIEGGQRLGLPISLTEGLALDRMGEGIGSALRLLSELADSTGKLFLIEEPENDLHPEALRQLLDFLVESSAANQFVISTHSDLVIRYLGSRPGTRIYRTKASSVDGLPLTTFESCDSREERLEVLRDLGYEPDLPEGWLLFEESTAERVCREVLIPYFAPNLAGLRTASASGASKLPRLLEDLERVVLCVHLSQRRITDAWVIVDGDEAGAKAIDELRKRFKTWPPDRFLKLDRPQFEQYYPARFSDERALLSQANLDWSQEAKIKGRLAERLCEWVKSDPAVALAELEVSAAGVISVLRAIAAARS